MDDIKDLISLAKRRGFIFQGSAIYGGLANTWDYGPLGVELKRNIKNKFWKKFVTTRNDMYGFDAAILMHPKTWEASGHLSNFSDPLIDCKSCRERSRADTLIEDQKGIITEGKSNEELEQMIKDLEIKCPKCGKSNFTEVRNFNLMFKTFQGVVEGKKSEIFLRPETCQGIFTNFNHVVQTMRPKLPFGIAQIGKSFRNEITPGNYIFRTREFEQMEIEYFVKPGQEIKCFDKWVEDYKEFILSLGIKEENLRLREHDEDELSHYSNKTVDFEYKFPWGWGELMGIASRTDFDLTQHTKHSNEKLNYFDPYDNKRYTPYVIEPSCGVERLLLAVLIDAFNVEQIEGKKPRTVLSLDSKLAPIKIAILPLKRTDERIKNKALEIYKELSEEFYTYYDETGSIGKLYRRQDEIGTPYCVTVDFNTIEDDNCVTVRDRDTMQQERVAVEEIKKYFKLKL